MEELAIAQCDAWKGGRKLAHEKSAPWIARIRYGTS